MQERPFRIVAFDWDGTAVKDRRADARPVARALQKLMELGVQVVLITGTNYTNIERQFACHIAGPHKNNLFVCTNRGSEVFGYDARGEIYLLYLREATDEENELLDRIAEAVKEEVESSSRVNIDIIYDRLNRRKIDLIPEWPDPPKSQIGRLIKATEKRLRAGGWGAGIKGVVQAAQRHSQEMGLFNARITSDVKHVEVGLTDKSDSIRWMLREVAQRRNIPYRDIVILGDEFGPIAGFEGSDFRMVLPEAEGVTYLSVGKEPNGVPPQVTHLGGGPRRFLDFVKRLESLHRRFLPTSDPTFLVTVEGFDPQREREVESIFTMSNGYLGTRGSLPEQDQSSSPATLVAGVFDRRSRQAPEELVIFPDWLFTRIYVDEERLQMKRKHIVEQRRVLDMSKGVLYRELLYEDITDRLTCIRFTSFASLAQPHLLILRVTVVPRNYRGQIRIETGLPLNPKANPPLHSVTKAVEGDGNGILIRARTLFTGVEAVMAQRSRIAPGFVQPEHATRSDEGGIVEIWSWDGQLGQELTMEKLVCVFTSQDGVDPEFAARGLLQEVSSKDFEDILLEHAEAWRKRWDTAGVRIEGDEEAQHRLNFALYHLIAAGNSENERVSIGARALSGPIYKGHIFWDSEMFILPFFIFTHPPTARAMIMYRYHTLRGARANAASRRWRGALYAWESTSDGEEMTPPAALAPTGEVIPILSGKLEHHINAAVAHGVWAYWNATHDHDFLRRAGAEILVETARFWVSRTEEGEDGLLHIREVEGPDEYHEGVDDNLYTNLMAAYNLRHAAKVVELLESLWPEDLARLREEIGLEAEEREGWLRTAGRIYRDGGRPDGVVEQFAGYFALEDIDVRRYRPHAAALDTILGRERTAASQLVKQADVVMLLYLLEEMFDEEALHANFLYYDRRTAHGSSLSPAIYGLVAARLGLVKEALEYLRRAGTIDLADNMGNAAGGVHVAAMGGLWQQVVMGFGGVRAKEEGLFLDPRLPSRWGSLEFPLAWRGCRLRVKVKRKRLLTVQVEGGEAESVPVGIHGRSPQAMRVGHIYRSTWTEGGWSDFQRAEET